MLNAVYDHVLIIHKNLFTDLPEGETLLERLYDAFCALMAQVSAGEMVIISLV